MDDFFALLFGLDGESLFSIARHNRRLYRLGIANKNIVQHTTIGWRPDPLNGLDGFEEVQGPTPSGNVEYRRVLWKGK